MQIEELSKSQIVLLTLLVSFVTSIATGIVTVSLMDQAPPAITQSVDRIIERTVEKVVPGQAAAVVTTKTVIVKQSDLIQQALEIATPSVVRLYSDKSTESIFYGFGIVIDEAGTIVGDLESIGSVNTMYVVRPDTESVEVIRDAVDEGSGTLHLRPTKGDSSTWTPARLSNTSLGLGETVIILSGKVRMRIGEGIVTELHTTPAGGTIIDTNIGSDWILPGGVIINTDGEVVGVNSKVSRAISGSAFIPASALLKDEKKAEE
ncbi:MAG TPA: hypothetical protein VJH33_04090 [Candidatus Paceibacterota bacterium]